MPPRSAACLAAALALAGCGRGTPHAAPSAAANAGPTAARIAGLNERQRRAVFLRAILDANQDCQDVTVEKSAGIVDGRPTWLARCRDRSEWIVTLQDGGTFYVTPTKPAATADAAG